MRTALTIAGSDPSGGAGIQADLKTFAAFDVYGASAITAITVQNTLGVDAVAPLSADLVTAQIEAIAGDFDLAATKIGMLATAAIVEAVAAAIAELDLPLVVVDPVLVSTNGDRLLEGDDFKECRTRRIERRTAHGTGCIYAAAIAASLALGRTLREAARLAQT